MRFLIIGQGLAGTLIGYRLEQAGHMVHYLDAPQQTAASAVAAGIINPITGRRFVKSWQIDALIPAAKSLYQELEALLGEQFWHELPLIRTLYHRGDVNDWQVRSADPGYAAYMEEDPDPGQLTELTESVFAYAGVRQAARVDVASLVAAYRRKLQASSQLRLRAFNYLPIPNLLQTEYDHIICCEGWRARHNPYFSYLPHGGNKGEILLVKTKAPLLQRMFKHRVFLVPLTDNTYWIGATSENEFTDDAPTSANRNYLEDRLQEVLKVPYTILAHRAAVRPTVRDRRPFLGQHPDIPGLWIFNGLGTKGASLAPLNSQWLVENILNDTQLPEEVDIRRFGKK